MANSTKDDGVVMPLQDAVDLPSNIDRRSFLMRHAVIGAAATMTGTTWTGSARAQQAAKEAAAPKLGGTLSPDLNVVKASKGPVMILADEFYKVGPGPSSSHTIGPMRITYDFYQRCTKLPADQLAKATNTLRTASSNLGTNLNIIQTRQDFTLEFSNVLTEGASKLTQADQNEESANMLTLQTRQQLGTIALSLANQAQQAILRLF